MSNPGTYVLSINEYNKLAEHVAKKYGPISNYYQDKTLELLYSVLTKFKRVSAIRCDLRFAQDHLGGDVDSVTCFQRSDPNAITRFFESLKSQLREEQKRKGLCMQGSPFEYVWVREQDRSLHPHYHVMLFFNRDYYAFLGNYTDPDAVNMATRIQKAWCSSLRLDYPDYSSLVHFPSGGVYRFTKNDATANLQNYLRCLHGIAYFWKIRTKDIGDGQRNFGRSQG